MLAQWVQQSEALPVVGQPWLTAWPKMGSGGVGLLAYVTPSFDLTIQRYLDALQRLLEEEETVVVREATLDYTLHEAHPVGYLHYTLTPAQTVATANGSPQTSESPPPVDGYQYLFFDRDGTTLLVMTFVVPQNGSPVVQPIDQDPIFAEMISIVQAATTTDLQESQ